MLEAGCAEEARAAPSACGGAQGGALALGGGARSRAFARDWADAYLAHWAATAAAPLDGAAERTFASDQRPLLDLMARHCGDLGAGGAWAKTKHLWTLGPLPETMNVRSLEGPASCASPLFGPLLFIHHKRYVNGGGVRDAVARLDGLCGAASRPVDDGGRCWLGRRPRGNASRVRCGWMTPKGAAAGVEFSDKF